MNRVYLLLGGNMGDRQQILESACALLIERLLPDYLEVDDLESAVNSSGFYETDPWGFESQSKFLNMAFVTLTEKEPVEVLSICKEIERELGRSELSQEDLYDKMGNRVYSERPIDIDIIFFDKQESIDGKMAFVSQVVSLPDLQIPHPLMQERMFVLDPLSEVAGEYRHPLLKKSVKVLKKSLKKDNR